MANLFKKLQFLSTLTLVPSLSTDLDCSVLIRTATPLGMSLFKCPRTKNQDYHFIGQIVGVTTLKSSNWLS
jgi:hypothetical protein